MKIHILNLKLPKWAALQRNYLSLSYRTLKRSQLDDGIIQQCAELFSSHYGVWSEKGHTPGQKVKLSMQKLKEKYLFDDDTYIVIATNENGKVIGHAIGKTFFYHELDGYVSWITQLVVHSDYRNKCISIRLCQMAWDLKHSIACGMVTSHPYSVKALKKSTNCDIDKEKILLHGSKLVQASKIPYLLSAIDDISYTERRCVLNTKFYVSHDEIDKIISETNEENQFNGRRGILRSVFPYEQKVTFISLYHRKSCWSPLTNHGHFPVDKCVTLNFCQGHSQCHCGYTYTVKKFL